MDNFPIEKRTHSRLNAYHLVKYRLLSRPQDEFTLAGVRNISGGGVCLQVQKPLPVESVIQVLINFPTLSVPIQGLAKVVWAKKDEKSRNYDLGIQFIEMEESLRQEIIKRIDEVYKNIDKTGKK